MSRALGRRWPEVQRVPEHLVLYSARGLGALLGRCGFEVLGWHSIGKRSTVHTLLADVAPIAPPAGRLAQRLAARLGVADRSLELDPRTKLVLYAARRSRANGLPRRRQPRLRKPKLAAAQAPVTPETAVLEDLNLLASARNLCDWMFSQFEVPAGARVVEIGAGIGTFSRRLLDAGASELLLVEPEDESADVLERRFAATPNVRVVRELLPDSPSLRAEAGTFDLVLCQNVLEHVEDDTAAVAAMAGALVRGGRLSLLVPAHRFLFGRLDEAYGHYRRYTRTDLCRLLEDAGLRVERTYSFNALGVPGWLVANRRANGRIGTRSLELYDRIVPLWRRIEAGASLPIGLSLIAHGRKP